jgi:autotransporter translocation and assembly factor TamB
LLERARAGLGLDRLRLGIGGARRGAASVEGGRDITNRVHLGARYGRDRADPRAVLRFQPGPQIRLESDVGPSGGIGAGAGFEIEY